MMMIPGEWEPRHRSGAPVNPVNVAESLTWTPNRPVTTRGGKGLGPETRRREPPIWLKVSIFAATLLGAMVLAMTAFFD